MKTAVKIKGNESHKINHCLTYGKSSINVSMAVLTIIDVVTFFGNLKKDIENTGIIHFRGCLQ